MKNQISKFVFTLALLVAGQSALAQNHGLKEAYTCSKGKAKLVLVANTDSTIDVSFLGKSFNTVGRLSPIASAVVAGEVKTDYRGGVGASCAPTVRCPKFYRLLDLSVFRSTLTGLVVKAVEGKNTYICQLNMMGPRK